MVLGGRCEVVGFRRAISANGRVWQGWAVKWRVLCF